MSYNNFINNLKQSAFGLDLNGVGDPNKRTFEILSQGSLRISEYNDMKWPFDEDFSEETIFKDGDDFIKKINNIINDTNVYNKCISNQMNIYGKYFNKKWIRDYIINYI
jgi:spore maturation protein CgeB